jgi:hypothetical protein
MLSLLSLAQDSGTDWLQSSSWILLCRSVSWSLGRSSSHTLQRSAVQCSAVQCSAPLVYLSRQFLVPQVCLQPALGLPAALTLPH